MTDEEFGPRDLMAVVAMHALLMKSDNMQHEMDVAKDAYEVADMMLMQSAIRPMHEG